MRMVSLLALALLGLLLFPALGNLPATGDPASPPSIHVSPRYIEGSHEETGADNAVTAVVVDYRGYDTFGETVVIFTAGVAAMLILQAGGSRSEDSL